MKNKLRIGVWIEKDYRPEIGGGFGYYDQIINLLKDVNDERFEFKFISEQNSNLKSFNKHIYEFRLSINRNRIQNFIIRYINKFARIISDRNIIISEIENRKKTENKLKEIIDVIYYPTPNCPIDFFPFIATVF